MKVFDFNSLLSSKELKDTPIAVAIGVFDGVHLGHQDILKSLKENGKKNRYKTLVVTFNVNPKNKEIKSLDTLRLRKKVIETFSIDYLVVIDFSSDFSMISGSEFIRLLCTMCRIKTVIVGEDFKCGNPKTRITAKELEGEFTKLGFNTKVDVHHQINDEEGIRISSTILRDLISQGKMERSSILLGRAYELDLSANSPIEKENSTVYEKSSLVQALPPEGRYRVEVLSKGNCINSELLINAENLEVLLKSKTIETLRIITKE